jgi:O-antigen/teichoic acid export membrane protein
MGLGLLVAIVLARALGPEGYGTYSFVFAMVSLIAVPSQLGLPNVVVRETARAQLHENFALMRGLWRWATGAAALFSLALAGAGLVVALVLDDRLGAAELTTFAWSLVLVPLRALGNLRGAALRGLRRVVLGQLPETVLRPAFLLVLLLGLLLLPTGSLTPARAMGLHSLAAGLAFVAGGWMLLRARPAGMRAAPPLTYQPRAWITAALPLALVSGANLVIQYTDVLVLGLYRPADEVGLYRTAALSATTVAFGVHVVTTVAAPHFARLHAAGETARLQRVVTASTWAILLLTVPVVLAAAVGGGWILGHAFGIEYLGARDTLSVLLLGQLVRAVVGPVAMLLIMTGHEGETARGMTVGAVANLILNLLLVPSFGMIGAAAATAASLAVWSVLLWSTARRRLGIETLPFVLPRR